MSITEIAQSYDFFNPFVSVAIISIDTGDVYPLWTVGKDGAAINVESSPAIEEKRGEPLKALSYVSEVQVEMQPGAVPRITVKLTPPYIDAIKFLDSELVEFGSHYIQVQFGYAKGVSNNGELGPVLSEKWAGLIIEPQISIGMNTEITLIGQGVAATWTQTEAHSAKTMNATVREIITYLCSTENMEANFDAVEGDDKAKSLLDANRSLSIGWRSAVFLLNQLVNECQCFGLCVKNTADGKKALFEVLPYSIYAKQEPEITLAMYHLSKGIIGGRVFPILSVTSSATGVYLPGVRSIIIRDINEKTKKKNVEVVTDEKVKVPRTWGTDTPVTPEDNKVVGAMPLKDNPEDTHGYQPHHGNPSNSTAVTQAHSAFSTQTLAQGFPMEIETMGIPFIRPKMLVKVSGLGLRFDTAASYSIEKVLHTFNVSGYSTNLNMTGNGGIMLAAHKAFAPSGPTNKSTDTKSDSKDTVTPKAIK